MCKIKAGFLGLVFESSRIWLLPEFLLHYSSFYALAHTHSQPAQVLCCTNSHISICPLVHVAHSALVSGTIPGAGETAVNKMDKTSCLHEACIIKKINKSRYSALELKMLKRKAKWVREVER